MRRIIENMIMLAVALLILSAAFAFTALGYDALVCSEGERYC